MFHIAGTKQRPGTHPPLFVCSLYFCVFVLTPGIASTAEISRPAAENGPTQVRLQMGVIDVDEINSVNQSFTANVYFEARWRDPRLAHKLEGEIAHPLNAVWNPRLHIVNQQRVVKTFPEVVEVSPGGDVVYRQRIWGPFSQRLDVRDFPFDRQVFRIRLAAVGYSPSEVDFVENTAGQPKVAPELSVADWILAGWKQQPQTFPAVGSGDLVPGYELWFEGQRQMGYYVLKVVLPLMLIVAMSWTVFWINPEHAGPQIGVSTTSMLTLIAYRFMVGGSLPTVSYLTRMDYFIFGSMILVFITLVEAVATSVLADGGRTILARRIDCWCRWIIPIGFVLVCVLAFIF